jgi:hypothetical protein
MKFTEEDIRDKDRLERMVQEESEHIFSSVIARKGRTLAEVQSSVRQGKVAELWLIENEGYVEAGKRWHDLRDENGDLVEVKAYSVNDTGAPMVQRDLKRIREEGWNTSRWYILFKYEYGTYELLEKIEV